MIDALTSLRFFAALGVVLCHIRATMPGVYDGGLFDRMSDGVDFFFVLSGYVLAITYRKGLHLKTYAVRRFARIFPLYLLTTMAWMALWLGSWGISPVTELRSGIAHALFLQAFIPGFAYVLGFNAVAWSISCEAFFYALFPWLRDGRRALATALIGGALYIALAASFQGEVDYYFPGFLGYFPPARVYQFAAGIALAYSNVPMRGTLWEIAATALAAAFLFPILQPAPFLESAYVTLASALLIGVFAHEAGALSRLLRQRWLVLLGESSYALYLWHHMLMLEARSATPWQGALVIASIVLLSVVTYLYVESPARRLISRVALRQASPVPQH